MSGYIYIYITEGYRVNQKEGVWEWLVLWECCIILVDTIGERDMEGD